MLSPRWKKILRDLTSNKARTILVTISIVVGIFAVGVVRHINTVIVGEMERVYLASRSAHATIGATGVDDDLLKSLERVPGVAEIEGRSGLGLKVEVSPGRWENFNVTAIPDFEDMQINVLQLVYEVEGEEEYNAAASAWPKNDELVLESGSLSVRDALPPGIKVGDTLRVQTPDEKIRTLKISGLDYDPNTIPATFQGTARGHVTPDTLRRLGGEETYTEVVLRAEGTEEEIRNREYVQGIANLVAAKIERSGLTVRNIRAFRPGRLPLQDLIDSLSLILTPLGLLALILGCFLVINTMSALMSQQTRQIGVMKAIGARRSQVVVMYITAVLLYSILALIIVIPATAFVASAVESVLGNFINLSTPGFIFPMNVLLIQIAIGLFVPLAATLYPILRGTAITVREAISDYGVGKGQFGQSWFDRFLSRIRSLSRPARISVRNTFRRRGRLILTLITLVMGGMIFMTVGSVRSSLNERVESVLAYNNFDIRVRFERSYRTKRVEQVALSVGGVLEAESWSSGSALRIRDDGSESDPINITALPPTSDMVQPTLVSGRWLLPDDHNAVVLSQSITSDETDIEVGSKIVLEIDEKEQEWVVVGFAETTEFGGNISAFVTYGYFSKLTGNVGRASSLLLRVDQSQISSMQAMTERLSETYEKAGVKVDSTFTAERIRRFTGNFFTIIISLLLFMGVLIASVGALGLAGTMSTNVMERTREIGVMRAIGASDGAVLRIVLIEGVVIGMLSWLIGAALAFPTGFALSSAVGFALFQAPLTYVFSSNGVFTWLGIVIILATVASFLPAQGASRLTVREVLAYE